MSPRHFDLNIERVLEHWPTVDALRELFANALDEAAITGTAAPRITAEGECQPFLPSDGVRSESVTSNPAGRPRANRNEKRPGHDRPGRLRKCWRARHDSNV